MSITKVLVAYVKKKAWGEPVDCKRSYEPWYIHITEMLWHRPNFVMGILSNPIWHHFAFVMLSAVYRYDMNTFSGKQNILKEN